MSTQVRPGLYIAASETAGFVAMDRGASVVSDVDSADWVVVHEDVVLEQGIENGLAPGAGLEEWKKWHQGRGKMARA